MCLAIPGKVIEFDPDIPTLGVVEVIGVRRRVEFGLLKDDMPVPGEWVLIHIGLAMSRVTAKDAGDQMRMLRMLGEDAAAMEETREHHD